MKMLITVLCFITALPVLAYQTGSVSRPNFSTSAAIPQQDKPEGDKTSAAPGQTRVQTRSFTSYGARQGSAWRQGVQTKPVQTQTAAPAVKDVPAQPAKPAATKAASAAPAQAAKPSGKPAGQQPQQQAAGQQPAAAQTENPADIMKQLQGMPGLEGLMGGKQSGSGAAKGAGALPGMPAGMPNVPGGMPDISALMNMSGQNAAGKK